ncbi:MAG: NAD(P)-dependent glycerol-3-phosphate dehydrogenase [Gemmatimonadaceae bacterium]|nr:NAD(P)-dependent glycerol-3-phosphate dehydrogenase [Gemmatimonadaceae bacterium]
MRCSVIGAGAWGTALANLLASNGHDVTLWALESEVVESINTRHINERFLAGHPLESSLIATGDLTSAVSRADFIIAAAPSHALRAVLSTAKSSIDAKTPIVVATKGIESETLALMTEVAEQELPQNQIVAISGPSFAAEVASRQPTAVVVASTNEAIARRAQTLFSTDFFRAYSHTDICGVEIGGSLKNVMAVATGIAEGLGLGFNARAALITRGLAEMTRLGVARGAKASTFAGLAGLGDLVLTCTGSLSRNRSLGMEIGQGRPLDEVLKTRDTVAEGVVTTRSARALAQREGVEMPIVETVYRVLFAGQPARDAIGELMSRELKAENA